MKQIIFIVCGALFSLLLSSCESCARKAAKEATNISLSILEGVSEAVSENGEETSEKATDALGKVAKGVGKSLDRQLNEHAKDVASVTGRTLVQSFEGLDKGLTDEYYTPISTTNNLCEGVRLEYFGRIKSKSVIDAYFVLSEDKSFNAEFDFVDSSNNTLMKKSTKISQTSKDKRSMLVSFALNEDELDKLSKSATVKVSVTPI